MAKHDLPDTDPAVRGAVDNHRAGIFLCPSSLAEADAPLVDLEAVAS